MKNTRANSGGNEREPAGPGRSAPRITTGLDALLIVCACGFFFFFGLAYFGLIGADEPRYAQVAREMLARHDWITPTLGGKPWLEKPALYYWQAMLAYAVFGVSDWAARLPSAFDATCMVAAIYLFLRRFHPGAQIDGALMTASSAGVIGFSRAASMDMPLTACFTISLLAWYAWFESKNKAYLGTFYVFAALGMLAKGPVAPALAVVVIVVFAIAAGNLGLIRRTLWGPGIALFCVVALPWYVAVQWKAPQFFREFILQHNLARFGTNLYHHKEPIWYYLPVTSLGLVPWIVLVAAALIGTIIAWRKNRRQSGSEDTLSLFLVIWLLVPLIFFSFSQSKLPGYVLPALPAATVLLACYLRAQRAANRRLSLPLLAFHALVSAGLIMPALLIRYLLLQPRLVWSHAAIVPCSIALVMAMAIALTLLARPNSSTLRFVTIVPVVLAVTIVLRLGASEIDAKLSARPVANEIAAIDHKKLPLAVFQTSRETEYGLAFYCNQIIGRYEFGQIPTGEHFVVAPAGSQAAVATQVPGRHVSFVGEFAPQNLEYFWVSAAPE
ncbi:MAG TPA: glycosyltransferase family 39 protein [Terriglobales bacterium]